MAGDKHRLAVLPLANISADTSDEYFADGMTEELISTLSKVTGLSVIARTSAMRYKGATRTVAEIGKELNIRTLLEGSVRKAANKVRINVQLIDAQTEERIWSQVYDRDLEDIFAIQGDIAQRVARALRVQIVRHEKRAIEKRATSVMEAYTLYLRGRHSGNKRTEEGLRTAVSYFEQALENDPSYALAYSGLADAYALLAWFEVLSPHDAFPNAKAAAERAVRLDDQLAEAHTSLGLVKFQYDWDWAGAESEFRRAIELNPSYPAAHQFYADHLKAMGRFGEAIAQMTVGTELDPLSLSINTGLGHVLYLSRQYDRAIEQYRKALELDPGFLQAHLWFGRPYLQKGMYKEAIEELQQAVRLSSGSTISLAVLGHAYAAAGNKEEATRILRSLLERAEKQYLPSYWIALIYTGLGDKDEAFEWLERARQERSSWLAWIKVEPRFDLLRPDPRFPLLLRKMGLTDAAEVGISVLAGAYEQEGASMLGGLATMKLSRYRVVGNCFRYEEGARNLLKDLKQKIAAGVEAPSQRNENYLVWSPPGGGKTFFVQQVRSSVGTHVGYEEINLAEADESGFRSRLAEIARNRERCLCFVDEIDSRPNEPWPYEALLTCLDPGAKRDVPKVFILAGSSGANLAEMERNLASRAKGSDLLSRVPHENRYSIPTMTTGDRLLVTLASFRREGTALGRHVAEIEKSALYYILYNPQLVSARQIREFALRSLQRVPRGEDRVKYDHLFDPGDTQNKEFWMRTRSSVPELINSFVMIDE